MSSLLILPSGSCDSGPSTCCWMNLSIWYDTGGTRLSEHLLWVCSPWIVCDVLTLVLTNVEQIKFLFFPADEKTFARWIKSALWWMSCGLEIWIVLKKKKKAQFFFFEWETEYITSWLLFFLTQLAPLCFKMSSQKYHLCIGNWILFLELSLYLVSAQVQFSNIQVWSLNVAKHRTWDKVLKHRTTRCYLRAGTLWSCDW